MTRSNSTLRSIGLGTNLIFIRLVLKAARNMFQKTWLRDNRKIDSYIDSTRTV